MFRIPAYIVLFSAPIVSLATLYKDPSYLYRFTREDGAIEWATVIALLALSTYLFAKLRRPTPKQLPRILKYSGIGLGVLSLLGVLEEISWGQRLFGFETSPSVDKLNLQHEMNFHNFLPAQLFNGLIVFALGIGFVFIPVMWRQRRSKPPTWLPTSEISLLTLDALLINHYVYDSLPEKVGIVVLFVLLTLATAKGLWKRDGILISTTLAGWLTAGGLYHARSVLRLQNHQYEIRELLIVILIFGYIEQTLAAYEKLSPTQDVRR